MSAGNGKVSVSARLAELQAEWPQTAAVLEETYWAGRDAGVTLTGGENDAGYALWGLRRFKLIADKNHAQHDYTSAELDCAAASEVRYHWRRGTAMRRPVAVFVKAWERLLFERAEKLMDARRACSCARSNRGSRSPGPGGAGASESSPASSTSGTGMPLSSPATSLAAVALVNSLSASLESKTATNIAASTIGGQRAHSRSQSCWPGRSSPSFRGGHGQTRTGG